MTLLYELERLLACKIKLLITLNYFLDETMQGVFLKPSKAIAARILSVPPLRTSFFKARGRRLYTTNPYILGIETSCDDTCADIFYLLL